jgi:exodeoxyribonuclease V gamma subunit
MLAAGSGSARMAVRIVYGNRLDALADRLIADAAADPLPPLVAQTIVVAHAGVGQWLAQHMALRVGVAAHLDLPLPGAWMWRLLRAVVPDLPEASAWSPQALAFRLHARLGEPLPRSQYAAIASWPGLADPTQRWRLAQRLARVYDGYLVYRPDWLLAWEARRSVLADDPDEAWQSALWRDLVIRCREAHRARLLARLAAGDITLDRAALPPVVRVFGVSSLAPSMLDFLAVVARSVPVCLYVLTPCTEYWADLSDSRQRAALARRRARLGIDGDDAPPVHGLLESLGTVGRDFQGRLYATFDEVDEDDVGVEPEGDAVLARIQQSLLRLDQSRLALESPPPDDDASLRLHPCASEQREVEVLREAVLRALEDVPGLEVRDIAIMSPDPARYAGLVEAVFGDRGGGEAIAIHVADRDAGQRMPLLDAYLAALDPASARRRLHDVVAMFEHAAVRRRFAIDRDEVLLARDRLAAAGMQWGIDSAARAAAGAGADATGTWRASRQRLLAAHALGEDEAVFVGDLVTTDAVGAPAARALAAVFELVDRLDALRGSAPMLDTMAGWRGRLLAHFDALFAIDPRDDAELAARDGLAALLTELVDAAESAGVPVSLPLAAVHETLARRIEDASSGRPWLGAGACVAGMVPMRSVPFRMIALLGLDADAFPRREPPDPFDLARRHPRPGDRDRARDDHWLLVEAIASCSDRLHLSWVARDARGDRVRPPSPAVQLILDSLLAGRDAADTRVAHARLLREPPAQPWDPAHYRSGGAWQSSDPRWLPPARRQPVARFATRRDEMPAQPAVITLDSMIGNISRPARAYLAAADVGRIAELPESDDGDGGMDTLANYRIRSALVAARLAGADPDPLIARAIADGALPVGAAGRRHAQEQLEWVDALLAAVAPVATAPARVQRLSAVTGTAVLRGDSLLCVRPGQFRWDVLLADWIRLCALAREGVAARLVVVSGSKQGPQLVEIAIPADAAPWDALVDLATRVPVELPPWLPRSAGEAAAKLAKDGDRAAALVAAAKAWRSRDGDAFAGEGDAPEWQLAMRGRDPLVEPEFLDWAERIYLPLIAAAGPAP